MAITSLNPVDLYGRLYRVTTKKEGVCFVGHSLGGEEDDYATAIELMSIGGEPLRGGTIYPLVVGRVGHYYSAVVKTCRSCGHVREEMAVFSVGKILAIELVEGVKPVYGMTSPPAG